MFAYILEVTLRSLMLGALVAIALTGFRVRNIRVQKTVWTMVLFAAAGMPALLALTPLTVAPASASMYEVVTLNGLARTSPGSVDWLSLLLVIYLMVAAVLLVRFSVGMARAWDLRRESTRVHEPWVGADDIRLCPRLRAAATFGHTILLPVDAVDWEPAMREAVLAHERAHVRAHDSYVQWLATLYRALFWVNPLAWWLRSRLIELAELTSDAAGVEATRNRAAYAEILRHVCMAAGRTPVHQDSALLGMANEETAARRIEQILHASLHSRRLSISKRVAVAVALFPALALSTGVAVDRSQFDPAHQPDKASDEPRVVWAQVTKEMYPNEARRLGVEGKVVVSVTLDANSQLTNAQVTTESPQGYGFGAAAVVAARTFKYLNPTGRPVTRSFNVRFELDQPRS